MKKTIAGMMVTVWILSQVGCASIVSGKSQDVNIHSNPAGADVLINEMHQGTTPLIVKLKRKQRHKIRFTKAGYADEVRTTGKGFNWWFTGNLIFGGLIGIIVDFATGAVYKVTPEDVNVTLVDGPQGAVIAPVPPAPAGP